MGAGEDMESGMGMLTGSGNATSDNRGPSLGRGMGVGSTAEAATTNGPLSQQNAMRGMAGMDMSHGQMADMLDVAKDANKTPGFPQDVFMEGPMMAMDKMVEKPETVGLPEGWSGYVGGMMTLVRVLPPDLHDRYLELKKKESQSNMRNMSGMGGNHGI
jgi:manganese oxidase